MGAKPRSGGPKVAPAGGKATDKDLGEEPAVASKATPQHFENNQN